MANRRKNRDYVQDYYKGETDYSPTKKEMKGMKEKRRRLRKDLENQK